MFIALFLATAIAPANADEAGNDAFSDSEAERLSERQILEARLAELESRCAKACAAPVVSAKPKAKKAKKQAPKSDPIAEPPAPPVLIEDPKIALMQKEIDDLKVKISEIKIPPAYDDTALVARVVVLENAWKPGLPHAIVYTGVGIIAAQPLPGFDQAIRGRVDIGARYSWDLSESWAAGIYGEGGWEFDGSDVRLLFGAAHQSGFGAAIGAGYRCDVPTDRGCMAEATGGIVQGTYEVAIGSSPVGILVRPGFEINYASVPGPVSGMETRGTLNFDLTIGRAKTVTVTAH